MAHRPGGLITTGNWKNRRGIWRLDQAIEASKETWWQPTSAGQIVFDTPGTFQWTCPEDVFFVSVVCVGGGGGGGGYSTWNNSAGAGGGLGWKNNIPVVPGQLYTVVVGAGGTVNAITRSGNSYFISEATVAGFGGGTPSAGFVGLGPNPNGWGGGFVGDGGGCGGTTGTSGSSFGGGGAGGYSGNGGSNNGGSGQGGGGGAGSYTSSTWGEGAGGGVGLLGQGANGAGGSNGAGGRGGSGGQDGRGGEGNGGNGNTQQIHGGDYGGGGGGSGTSGGGGNGGKGAVRIIWSGVTEIVRAFPSTNTGNL